MLIDLIGIFIVEFHSYLQRSSIGRVAFLTLLDGILGLILANLELAEFKAEMSREIRDRRNIIEGLAQPLVEEPLVRVLLDIDQVRDLKYFLMSGKGHSLTVTGFDRMHSAFFHSTFHPCYLSSAFLFVPVLLHCGCPHRRHKSLRFHNSANFIISCVCQ